MVTRTHIFSHKVVNGKMSRSKISSFTGMDGRILQKEEEIKEEILSFYKQLLLGRIDDSTGGDIVELNQLQSSKVTDETKLSLIREVTSEEVFSVN